MEGYQLPGFDTTAPLKPAVSNNNTPSSGASSIRGFDSFAFLDVPPKEIVLSPPVSTPKNPNDELPGYEQSNLSSVQLGGFNASVTPGTPVYGYPTSVQEPQKHEAKPVSAPPSAQPPLYQLPFRPETPMYHPQSQQVVQQPQPLIAQPAVRPSAQPVYGYPGTAEHKDPVKALIEAYPNPQTEYEKLRQSIENMNLQLQAHFKKMEFFTESVDHRLASLESVVKELSGTSPKATQNSLYPAKPSERERSPSYKYKTSPKGTKKKKKSRTIAAYETDPKSTPAPTISETTESDEDLARRLQKQFNLEASDQLHDTTTTASTPSVSDEEYARRLQALYLKRDLQRTEKKKPGSEKKDVPATSTKKPEEKPSLWSRLFGGTGEEGKVEEDEDDTELKTITPKSAPATKASVYSPVPASAPLQPLPMTTPYGFYPQQPYMLGTQGMPQYAPYLPMQAPPGTQFVLPQQSHTN